MQQRKLLFVSYLFPPAGGITVQRALAFTRYLPERGFELHVLRAPNAPSPVIDDSLLNRVPRQVKIHGALTPEPPFKLRHFVWNLLSSKKKAEEEAEPVKDFGGRKPSGPKAWAKEAIRRMICPEPEILWVPFAVRAARKLVKRHGIEAVMVTAPPFSAFLVGTRLKREFPGLKFIADFRDEWLDFYLNESDFQSGDFVRKRATEIERETVELADIVVAVTHTSRDKIRRRYPELPEARFQCVHNGFDPAQFSKFTARPHNTGKVVVTHVGTAANASSSRYYLDALEALPAEYRDRIESRFVGRIAEGEKRYFENRKAALNLLGFQTQEVATRYMEETDYLLVTLTDRQSIPGKLFEYMATGKPILAISPPDGEVARIMAETRAGFCVDPSDKDALSRTLIHICSAPVEETVRNIDQDRVHSFERPRKADQLAQLIHGLF
ncbi:MAG: glycosyltransferase [Bryobacterales bacterium]|nr:glycosyltransferase [Bryobacterales bacterium]